MAFDVLLVEDNPGDVGLVRQAFRMANAAVELHVAYDGVEAMAFLRREGEHADAPRPVLVLLDLNLPRMDGKQVLEYIKGDEGLQSIPTVILSSSEAERDIAASYGLGANTCLRKPMDLTEFDDLVQDISDFWLTKTRLPPSRPAIPAG
jgi:chemotaxis family two-component system response regulator Rcp1